jgi:hypothetical protein
MDAVKFKKEAKNSSEANKRACTPEPTQCRACRRIKPRDGQATP